MRQYLDQLHDQMFGERFNHFLQKAYEKDVTKVGLDECDREFSDAKTYFDAHFTPEERSALAHIEDLQAQKRSYAGEYAFCCGMSVAFEQLFTENKALRYDFSERLDRGLYEVEGMKGHPWYYNWATEVRTCYDSLGADRSEQEEEHLTSHECGWDQRITSGAVAAYYLGYRAALAVIERVRPLATQTMMDQILMIEYQLGITLSAEERERVGNASA